jgi:hypothetical protein
LVRLYRLASVLASLALKMSVCFKIDPHYAISFFKLIPVQVQVFMMGQYICETKMGLVGSRCHMEYF